MEGARGNTNTTWSADVAYERFLAPEVFFQPEIYSSDFTTPLPEVRGRAAWFLHAAGRPSPFRLALF